MSDSSTPRYTGVAIFLHWLIALGIFCMIPLGVYMHDLPLSPQKLQLYSLHKSVGVLLLLLIFIRLFWRATHRPPALPAAMSAKEQRIAHGMSHALYLFMLLSPVTGGLMSAFFGKPLVLFGILPMPSPVEANEDIGKLFAILHEVSNYALCTLVALHILASLKHHFKDRDDVLIRMLPVLAKSRP